MADAFSNQAPGLSSPAEKGADVTPHDSTELTNHSRALWVGGAGDVVLITTGGSTLTLKNVPAGSLLPIRAKIVKATGTTATFIVALL